MVAVLTSSSETMKVTLHCKKLAIALGTLNSFLAVIISPPSPNGVYTVEVQRDFFVSCSGSNSDDIVVWIRKSLVSQSTSEFYDYLFTQLRE